MRFASTLAVLMERQPTCQEKLYEVAGVCMGNGTDVVGGIEDAGEEP